MSTKIYITGYGAIAALGNNVAEIKASLFAEKTGIRQGEKPYSEKYKVGEIRFSNAELIERFDLKNDASRTALLGMVAAKEAFENHVLHPDIRTGLISGTSVGGMDVSEKEYLKFLNGEVDNKEVYRNHPSGTTTQQIAASLGIDAYFNTISTACSSATNAIMMGARLIQSGQLDRVIVGGTDGLSQFTIAGFNSLMIFDEEWCRPFDETRKGLNLGEGAGFIVLEGENSLSKTAKTPLALVSGWSNACDAYHQTASSPDGSGAVLSMTEALSVAGLQASQIDYVNAHGTATPNNDLSESHALIRVFGEQVPPFSSTKSYTGHTLAASGGIEAIISILSIQEGVLFPNLNFSSSIAETNLTPIQTVTKAPVKHVLSNAFGFGGNNSTLIFSKI
ncbi:MAG: hypothetical protein RIT10_221 [Bacteroidota bacterium]|jgi:3-oxoacyl-[acyl-carrier-protein] synthase-1